MKQFSIFWRSSKSPRKQRKYLYNAPLHIRNSFATAHLSKELRKKHAKRSLAIRKGDTVKILRGQFKNKTGTIDRVDLKKIRAYIAGVGRQKTDGSKAAYPLHPSNLMITELALEDKRRIKSIERKKMKRA